MLDEKKIKTMIKLASFEQHEGKEALKIGKYYRSDYIGLNMIKSAVLATVGYCLLLVIWALYNVDFLMNNINNIDLFVFVRSILFGYAAFVILYAVIAYIIHSVRYHKASQSLKEYAQMLNRLERTYNREEKKTAGADASGGKRNDKNVGN